MSLSPDDRAAVASILADIERPVPVRLELGPSDSNVTLLAGGGRELDPVEVTRALVEEVCSLSDSIALEVVEHGARGPYPRTTVGGRVAFVGTPWGYELTSLVHGIAEAGRAQPSLDPTSVAALTALERTVALDVYVTPT